MSKVIVKSGVAKYAFSDATSITEKNGKLVTPTLIISDLNLSNSTIYENINSVPEDFRGDKYLFDGSSWTANPDYVEPETEE